MEAREVGYPDSKLGPVEDIYFIFKLATITLRQPVEYQIYVNIIIIHFRIMSFYFFLQMNFVRKC
jgi:hypothetical protein